MSTVPGQCKELRRTIRRKQHKFLTRLNIALPGILPGINVIIMDYCLPSRRIPDAIESTAHSGTNVILRIKDASDQNECTIQYQPCRYQGYGLYPDYRGQRWPWGVTVRDLLNIYLGEPKADLGGGDDGFVEDALRCVDGLRQWLDGIIDRSLDQ